MQGVFMWRLILAVIVVLFAGCGDGGPKLVKAGGAVKYNGAPLAEADVVFVPDEGGQPSISEI